ncbi:MAG: helix-turn-helix domain-containing protein [Deltaproteobacteria bacterium]|nr:helix-turn-helix domain-containing protein [Deltaproteobacteria bacterium]NIS76921.1 helix-turn-helix domain-containing protein [Deltaproteobacteria bacterium]
MGLKSMPNILKTRDIAILLDLSPDSVNDMARKGQIKGYKSGNQWRFRKKDVEKFLKKYNQRHTSGTG